MLNTRIQVIDSHTEGEPTRVVIQGGPDLGSGSLAERRQRFCDGFDHFRSAVIHEPRGSDVWVGALLCEPVDSSCVAGVIYFNNAGVLNMCGHGTIGVVVTLAHLGRITPGTYRLETPVGVIAVDYHGENRVTVENVPSYRFAKDVVLDVDGVGPVTGDIAWGGNWFFLTDQHGQDLTLANVDRLTDCAWRIRQTLERRRLTGAEGQPIDHIELYGPPVRSDADCRNFVLCPGKAYDRSPCGTGTSARIACLIADGKLEPGAVWRQESILGSLFEACGRRSGNRVIPRITGTAFVTAESTLILDENDPYRTGIRT